MNDFPNQDIFLDEGVVFGGELVAQINRVFKTKRPPSLDLSLTFLNLVKAVWYGQMCPNAEEGLQKLSEFEQPKPRVLIFSNPGKCIGHRFQQASWQWSRIFDPSFGLTEMAVIDTFSMSARGTEVRRHAFEENRKTDGEETRRGGTKSGRRTIRSFLNDNYRRDENTFVPCNLVAEKWPKNESQYIIFGIQFSYQTYIYYYGWNNVQWGT